MGLFSWFSKSEVTDFAKNLAAELAKRYPPAIEANPEKRISENRLTKILEDTLNRAVEFQQSHKLGTYGKAKLGNEFKWQLKELGYSERFVEVATEGLMVYITRGTSASGAASGGQAATKQ